MHDGGAAAVHIFKAYFDSLLGPQFRYEILDSTAYCGADDTVVTEAIQRSQDEPRDVVLYSPGVEAPRLPELEPQRQGEDDNIWILGLIATVIGESSP